MECKAALQEANGDLEEATTILRKRGLAQAAKKSGRSTSEGLIGSYIHMGGKIGVLVELNCESDFVARTDDFQTLLKEIALQVAAASPQYVTPRGRAGRGPRARARHLPRADGELRQAAAGDRQDRRGQARQLLRAGRAWSTSRRSATRRDGRPDAPGGDRQARREHRRRAVRAVQSRRSASAAQRTGELGV